MSPLGFSTAKAAVLPPRPQLSQSEALEIGVSSSDLIVIARIRAIRDSSGTHDSPSRWPAIPLPRTWRRTYLDLTDIDLVKGTLEDTRLAVAVPRIEIAQRLRRHGIHETDGLGLFFLEKRALGWVLASEFAPESGIMPVSRALASVIASRVRAIASAQSIEQLAERADLVVRAEVQGRVECETGRGRASCISIVVDSILAGSTQSIALRVYIPVPQAFSYGKALFFLRAAGTDTYELVGSNAGVLPSHARDGALLRPDMQGVLRTIDRIRSHRSPGKD
jgi:hypothetical protein